MTNKVAVVTGGSRGLGRGIVEALAGRGVKVHAVARGEAALGELAAAVPNVTAVVGDAADGALAARLLAKQPDLVVLCAGAAPVLGSIHEQTWESFQTNWNVDTKSAFVWLKEALRLPLKRGAHVIVVSSGAAAPLDEKPNRPADLEGGVWAEGMEWLYAGASPLAGGCSCPTQRLHVDWYKRTFVPEVYRHSFGVLDTAGNLIMHLGKYGNYDSGNGAKSKIPVGGDNIAMYFPRFISGTDNYLVFSDWGERLVSLKIAYEAEESVGIGL